MSKTNKRKHVMKELLDDEFELPKDNQNIVKVVRSKGNNLHEVVTPQEESYLVSMPTKFRNNIWVKRGNYVLVEPILEGDKVKAEIVRILNNDSIQHYKDNNVWPKQFEDSTKKDDKLDDDDLFVNPNRVNANVYRDSESNSSDSDSEDNT